MRDEIVPRGWLGPRLARGTVYVSRGNIKSTCDWLPRIGTETLHGFVNTCYWHFSIEGRGSRAFDTFFAPLFVASFRYGPEFSIFRCYTSAGADSTRGMHERIQCYMVSGQFLMEIFAGWTNDEEISWYNRWPKVTFCWIFLRRQLDAKMYKFVGIYLVNLKFVFLTKEFWPLKLCNESNIMVNVSYGLKASIWEPVIYKSEVPPQ